ncbi:hypothetical protein [Stieleria mannarensis]|uniref:hypothetical protein n=1 Tax=Stieleria mannarensis TaxID=2755585 RepID=UPI0016046A4A|nr:hypothetical protein [Rhodopirellula sp. JC639]
MTVPQILEQLRGEERRLTQQSAELQQQLQASQKELKAVQAAMKSLGLKPATKGSKRRTINRDDVIAQIEAALSQRSPIEADELKTLVKTALRKTDKSLHGYELRFREAVGGLITTPNGYQLPSNQDNSTSHIA